MITRDAHAVWNNSLKRGSGVLKFADVEKPYSFASRFEHSAGTNPEELIGAAHAGCFSMALALILGEDGYEPTSIRTAAKVYFDADKLAIAKTELHTSAEVPGLEASELKSYAEAARTNCPVSKALAGTGVVLTDVDLLEVSRT